MNELDWQLLEEKTPVESVSVQGVEIRKGSPVRLLPKKGGDIFDIALAGHLAAVESIEEDYEGRMQLAVVLENDPGKDLGLMRLPGHRFFFAPDEVEPAKVLIAGIGNIFMGDDGFGCEVIKHLAGQLPGRAIVRDFGIRGYDLAYALLDGYDLVIMVDAAGRGEAPGTVCLIEPDESAPATQMDAHAMDPVSVLRLAKSMGEVRCKVLLVACEPADLGGEEGYMGLSEPVSEAIAPAIEIVRRLCGAPREEPNVPGNSGKSS